MLAVTNKLLGLQGGLLQPFRWYHRQLVKWPLPVKCTTSGCVLGTADYASQRIKNGHPWDPHQPFWMGMYGALFVAPFCHNWYQLLERRIPIPFGATAATKFKLVLRRMFLDQLVVSPVFTSGLFISRGAIAGEDWRTIGSKIRSNLWKVIGTGALVWPPAQVVNFFWVPLPYRVLFMNAVGFVWSTYTSVVAAGAFQRLTHKPTS